MRGTVRVLLQTAADFRYFAPAERDCGKENGEYFVAVYQSGQNVKELSFILLQFQNHTHRQMHGPHHIRGAVYIRMCGRIP